MFQITELTLRGVAAAHSRALGVLPMAAPPGVEAKANTVLGWLKWAGGIAVVAGILMVAVRVAVGNRRGEGEENMKGLGYVIIAGILVGAAGAIGQELTK